MSKAPDNSAGEQPASSPDGEGPDPSRSLDDVFEALMARRRRYALYALSRTDGPTAVSDLAESVASLRGGDADLDRIAVSLHHVHLPKLAEVGVVDYDAEAGTVSLADYPDSFHRFVSLAAANERRSLARAPNGPSPSS